MTKKKAAPDCYLSSSTWTVPSLGWGSHHLRVLSMRMKMTELSHCSSPNMIVTDYEVCSASKTLGLNYRKQWYN
jgi:hypothetical protein